MFNGLPPGRRFHVGWKHNTTLLNGLELEAVAHAKTALPSGYEDYRWTLETIAIVRASSTTSFCFKWLYLRANAHNIIRPATGQTGGGPDARDDTFWEGANGYAPPFNYVLPEDWDGDIAFGIANASGATIAPGMIFFLRQSTRFEVNEFCRSKDDGS